MQDNDARARELFAIGGEIRELFFHYSPLPELSPAQFQMMRNLYQFSQAHRGEAARGHCPPFAAMACGGADAEGLKVTDLARMMRNAPPTVSQRADELEQLGYLARRRGSRDRRAVYLALTPSGEALMQRAVRLYDHLSQRLVARLGDAQFTEFLATLNNLKDALAAEQAEFAAALAAEEVRQKETKA